MKNGKMIASALISAIVYGIFAVFAEFLIVKHIALTCQAFAELPTGGYELRFSPNAAAIPHLIGGLLIAWTLVLCVLRAVKADFSKAWLIVTSASVAVSAIYFLILDLRRVIFVLVTGGLSDNIAYWLTSPVNILHVIVSAVLIVEAVVFLKCIRNR